MDCGTPLNTDLLSFNGKLANRNSHLSWITSQEAGLLVFAVEKSIDGVHFSRIGRMESHRNPAAEKNSYSFIDSAVTTEKAYYRLGITDEKARTKYSRIIQLGNASEDFKMEVTTNPFDKDVLFDVTVNKDSKIEVLLSSTVGNLIKQKSFTAYAGINKFSMQNTGSLQPGIYILQVQYQGKTLSSKLIKK